MTDHGLGNCNSQTDENRGTKRARDDSEPEEAPEAKIHRALQAVVMQMYDAKEPIEIDLDEEYQYEAACAAIGTDLEARIRIRIPTSYRDAVDDPEWGELWQEAVDSEIEALAANRTWESKVPPVGVNIVTSKWVFNVKYNNDDTINKFKARLVARGFTQRQGVDFEDTFAPTVRHDTLRLFLAVVCQEDLDCEQIDVNNAFTESVLKESIYMQAPDGVDVPPGHVLHLLRSIYGLKQAARNWNQLCAGHLIKMGFVQSGADPCLFVHPMRNMIVLVYVDDIPIAARRDTDDIAWFKKGFQARFKIKDLGKINRILGVDVIRNREAGTLRLDQSHYVRDALAGMRMVTDKSRPTETPMDRNCSLRKATPVDERTDKHAYQQQVGKWMYLAVLTRLDISYCLGKLSQYVSDPTTTHRGALKRLSCYIRSTADLGIQYTRSNKPFLYGYSDLSFADNKDTRRSTLGSIFFLAGCPISWSSRKQKSVATSTAEAEYMALSGCAKQSQWLAQILRDMRMHHLIGQDARQPEIKERLCFAKCSPGTKEDRVQLYGDNQASLSMVKDAQVSERSKHIDTAYHFVRELWRTKRIGISFVGTIDMKADGLTKATDSAAFKRFVQHLGLLGRGFKG